MVDETLADIVHLSGRFIRSARIDMDLSGTPPLEGYVLQASTEKSLAAMATAIAAGSQNAFTWTGPYGGGKSSTALLLGNLVAGTKDGKKLARKIAGRNLSKAIDGAFSLARGPWIVIPVTGSRSSLRSAVSKTLAVGFGWSAQRSKKAEASDEALLDELRNAAVSTGILLILDELGKFLEAAADNDHDAHLLQDIAEISARSDGRLIVIGILHQSFEAYADKMAASARQEWAKIQGRYQDLSFLSASDETVRLLGRAIEAEKQPASAARNSRKLAQLVAKKRPTDEEELTAALTQAWPLNPICALLLGGITRRSFGQNERSIFGFLASEEPGGFREFLAVTPAQSSETFNPLQLWDYLQTNFGLALASGALGPQMSLALEAIEKAEALGSKLHVSLAKSAALIEIFKNGTGLSVDDEIFRVAVPAVSEKAFSEALDNLCEWGVFLRQSRTGGYALFAGSDFDLDAALERYGKRATSSDLTHVAAAAGLDHVVAKRYYFDVGVLRNFALHLECLNETFDQKEFLKSVTRKAAAGSGVMVLVVAPNRADAPDIQRMMEALQSVLKQSGLVAAVSLAGQGRRLVEDASDLAALKLVQTQMPQIAGDRIARRAIRAREATLRNRSSVYLQRMLQDAKWTVVGAEAGFELGTSLSAAASSLADCAFPSCPIIHSELLQKDKPSSSAAAALRALCHAMVENKHEKNLGFEGFPAAFGLYLTTLLPAGLHRETNGTYGFHSPSNGEVGQSLKPAWKILNKAKEQSLASVYSSWKSAPFGMKLGVMPILALAFMLSKRDSYAVYQDSRFVAELDDVFVDRMLQDPESVILKKANRSDQQLAFLSRLAERLDAADTSALSVASAAFQRIEALTDYAKRTTRLSKDTCKIRDVIRRADDPESLLFDALPNLVLKGDLVEKIVFAIDECESAFQSLRLELRTAIAKAVGVAPDTFEGAKERARSVEGLSSDLKFEAFAMRLGEIEAGQGTVEALAGTLQPKPMRDWSDRNREGALSEIAQLGRRFRQAEAVAMMRARKSNTEAIALIVGVDPNQPPILQSFELSESEKATASALAKSIVGDLKEGNLNHELKLAALARAVAALTDDIDQVEA